MSGRGRGRGGPRGGGSRGGSRGGGGAGANRGGAGGGGGRGGGRGGRGGPRGGARGRGRGGVKRVFDNRLKESFVTPPTSEDEDSSSEEELEIDSGSESEDEGEEADPSAVKPYNALLESLAASKRADNKRRKISHTEELVTEEVDSDVDAAVEEEEEGSDEEDAVAEAEDIDSDDDTTDPYETHFAGPTPEFLSRIPSATKKAWKTSKIELPIIQRALLSAPANAEDPTPPKKITRISDLKLKQRLLTPFTDTNGDLTLLQKDLASYIYNYNDVLYANRTPQNADEIRTAYCSHALNHVWKTRDRVLKNNARLSQSKDDDLELRDQGFTRPKVLFILPTRNACVKVVDTLVSLVDPEQQENKKRFTDTYSLPPDEERLSDIKPADFKELFSGNHDDLFRLGLKFTRKTMKFFSQFYSSDIILASPLGLRLAIGDESDEKRDFDFLSSIELVVMDSADAILQQNWDHVEHVFKHLNLIPRESHGCDFSRVRPYYLDSHARYLRQTLIFSQYMTPELNSLFTNHMSNISGRLKSQPVYPGVLSDLGLQVRQVFTRFVSEAPAKDPDARFKYFCSALVPSILRNASNGGILVFIPSYFDFVRVRNYFANTDLSFGVISEETPVPDVSRARSHFLSGRQSVLLYTGRAHHFRRYEIRGVKDVVMYGLPDNEKFYKEVVGGFLNRSVGEGVVEGGRCKARVMFSKWDALRLERVVGSERVRVMCNDLGDTFEFV